MKNTIKIIGMCCVVVIIVLGIYFSIPSKTLDFRGTVTEIETAANETTIKISTPSIGTSYIVIADNKTKVAHCHKEDPEIDLTDIKVGDTIEGDYRWLSKDNKAKYITVWCQN